MSEKDRVYELIARHTTDLVCIHDQENTIRFATPSSAGILGYPPEELQGKKLTDFLTEDFINEMDFSTLTRFFNQPGARIRYQVSRQDGQLRWLETSFTQLLSLGMDQYRLLSTTRDITESVQLTEDLMQALSAEQELSKMKTNLYSVASHEFKTPLAIIQANIEMLKVKQDQRLLNAGLAAMEEEVDQLNAMINDMLQLKKLTSGPRDFRASTLQLEEIVLDVIKGLKGADNNRVIYQASGEVKHISGDYSLLRYVVSNLISNALKFSMEPDLVEVNLLYQTETVELAVKDRGIGIPEDEQSAVFQSFYRGKNVGNISGTGVGLAIAAEFVKLHQGKIQLKSKPGRGSLFTVTLPIKR